MSEEQRWYYSLKEGEQTGPVTKAELEDLISQGTLEASHKIQAEGSEDWKPLSETSFRDKLPKPPSPPSSPGNETTNALVAEAKEVGTMLPVFAKRAFSGGFHQEMATEAERSRLSEEDRPVSDPAIANFLSWRRAVLALATILFVITFCFSIPETIKSFDGYGVPFYVHLTSVAFVLATLGTIALTATGLLTWSNYQRSRRFCRLAVVTAFLIPFGIFLIPVRWFVSEFDTIGSSQWAGLAAVAYAISMLPLVISIFPAFLRSSLIMKSLIPESTLPGWIALIVAPFNSLFFLIGLVMAMQIGTFPGTMAFAALTAAPLVILLNVRGLVRSADPENATKMLANVRTGLLVCYTIAIIGIAWLLFSFENMSVVAVLRSVIGLIANIFFFNIVISDYFLGLIRFSFEEEEKLRDGPHHNSLKGRIEHAAGLEEAPSPDHA